MHCDKMEIKMTFPDGKEVTYTFSYATWVGISPTEIAVDENKDWAWHKDLGIRIMTICGHASRR